MTKEELLNLIQENPDAEVLFMCGEDSYTGEYPYSAHFLNEARIYVEKLALYDGRYYDDKLDLEDTIIDNLWCLTEKIKYWDFLDIVHREAKKYPFEKYIVIKIG